MIQADDEVRVVSMSGKNGGYVARPRRIGRVLKVEDDKGLVRFPQSIKRETSYYRHDHWFYLKDMKVVHRRPRKAKKRRRRKR